MDIERTSLQALEGFLAADYQRRRNIETQKQLTGAENGDIERM